MVNKSLLRSSDRRQPLASNADCAPPLEGFWTNPLVSVGEAQPNHRPDIKLVAIRPGL